MVSLQVELPCTNRRTQRLCFTGKLLSQGFHYHIKLKTLRNSSINTKIWFGSLAVPGKLIKPLNKLILKCYQFNGNTIIRSLNIGFSVINIHFIISKLKPY